MHPLARQICSRTGLDARSCHNPVGGAILVTANAVWRAVAKVVKIAYREKLQVRVFEFRPTGVAPPPPTPQPIGDARNGELALTT